MAKLRLDRATLRSNPPVYMNANEAALYMGFSTSTFNKVIRFYLPRMGQGQMYIYKREDLDKYISDRMIPPSKVLNK